MLAKFFPELDSEQIEQLGLFSEALKAWNQQINLVSRKDIEHFEVHHLIHCLAFTKTAKIESGQRVLDIGTGGGLPGLPLAILYPQAKFHLIDGSGKKIKVVKDIADQLGLKNVEAEQIRAENITGNEFDLIVTRAVCSLKQLSEYNHIIHQGVNLPDIYAWKGGDLSQEIAGLGRKFKAKAFDLNQFFGATETEGFFETKKIVRVISQL